MPTLPALPACFVPIAYKSANFKFLEELPNLYRARSAVEVEQSRLVRRYMPCTT